jgi:hypothetical protein
LSFGRVGLACCGVRRRVGEDCVDCGDADQHDRRDGLNRAGFAIQPVVAAGGRDCDGDRGRSDRDGGCANEATVGTELWLRDLTLLWSAKICGTVSSVNG